MTRLLVLLSLLMCLLPPWPALAQDAPAPARPLPAPTVLVAGRKLALEPAASVQDGVLIGPWAALARAHGARVNWYPNENLLVIVSATGKRLQVQPGQPLTIGEQRVELTPPARLVEGKLLGPLKPLIEALDGVLQWQPQTRTAQVWGTLVRLETRGDEQGVGVSFVTSLPAQTSLQHMPAPRRSFLDLPGIFLSDAAPLNYVNLRGLQRVRAGQFTKQPPSVRLVLDLADDSPAVSWQPREDDCGGRLVIGELQGGEPLISRRAPKLLKILAASHTPDTLNVTAYFSDPVPLKYDVLRQPYRVLVDLSGVEMNECTEPAAQALPYLEQVRLLDQGRLVLYMDEMVPFTIRPQTKPDRLQLQFARDTLLDKKIMVDPGHGGKDSGARGRKLMEKDVNLDVARRTAERLALMGAKPFLTRDSDVFIDLYARPRMTNELPADLFVSIHCNAAARRDRGSGTQTYHCHPQSKALAVVLHDALAPALGQKDGGVHQARFCVVRETQIPAVLVELLFIDNLTEENLLSQAEVRQRAAVGICEGLRRYLEGTNSVPKAVLVEGEG